MNARQTRLAEATTRAIQRAATGSDVRTSAWARGAAGRVAEPLAGAVGAGAVMNADGTLGFLLDYSTLDGSDVL